MNSCHRTCEQYCLTFLPGPNARTKDLPIPPTDHPFRQRLFQGKIQGSAKHLLGEDLDARWIERLAELTEKMGLSFFDAPPNGQYVAKKNRTLPILDGKEWERTGKPLISLGGCNFRKGKYLAFCR